MSPGTWCKWEQGGTTPHSVSLSRITQALGCTVERMQEVIRECRQERVGGEIRNDTSRQRSGRPSAHPVPLVRETDRMLRKIDRQLDTLLNYKSALLRMREQLVSTPSGGRHLNGF